MNKRVKSKWIRALRSGKYRKTKGVLHNRRGYCCLGVLCDVYKKDTGQGLWENDELRNKIFKVGMEWSGCGLPTPVRRWAGIKFAEGTFTQRVQRIVGHRSLIEVNDDTKSSFNQIASIINKYF